MIPRDEIAPIIADILSALTRLENVLQQLEPNDKSEPMANCKDARAKHLFDDLNERFQLRLQTAKDVSRLSQDFLLAQRNCGWTTVYAIQRWLQKCGLTLRCRKMSRQEKLLMIRELSDVRRKYGGLQVRHEKLLTRLMEEIAATEIGKDSPCDSASRSPDSSGS